MGYYNEKWGLSIKRYMARAGVCVMNGGMDAAVYFVCVCIERRWTEVWVVERWGREKTAS